MNKEETLEEIGESGTSVALTESVAKSRERNREKDQVRNNYQKINKMLVLSFFCETLGNISSFSRVVLNSTKCRALNLQCIGCESSALSLDHNYILA